MIGFAVFVFELEPLFSIFKTRLATVLTHVKQRVNA